jgi:hypothetical protein
MFSKKKRQSIYCMYIYIYIYINEAVSKYSGNRTSRGSWSGQGLLTLLTEKLSEKSGATVALKKQIGTKMTRMNIRASSLGYQC